MNVENSNRNFAWRKNVIMTVETLMTAFVLLQQFSRTGRGRDYQGVKIVALTDCRGSKVKKGPLLLWTFP